MKVKWNRYFCCLEKRVKKDNKMDISLSWFAFSIRKYRDDKKDGHIIVCILIVDWILRRNLTRAFQKLYSQKTRLKATYERKHNLEIMKKDQHQLCSINAVTITSKWLNFLCRRNIALIMQDIFESQDHYNRPTVSRSLLYMSINNNVPNSDPVIFP